MAEHQVVYYPDDPLTKKTEPFESFDKELEDLANEMFETMYKYDGVGLAGPQIGLSRQIVVMFNLDTQEELCLVNPNISEPEGSQENEEGCLSLPGLFARVKRPNKVQVNAFDQFGHELDFIAEGFLACVIQHEVDHLNGTVFIDRLDFISREAKYQEWLDIRKNLHPGDIEKAGDKCL